MSSVLKDDFIRYQMEIHSAVKKQRLRRHSEGEDHPEQNQHSKIQQQSHTFFNSQSVGVGEMNQQNAIKGCRRLSLGDIASTITHSKIQSGGKINEEPRERESGTEQQIRCRNPKCNQSAFPGDAKKVFKSCHNCSHLYCSRECRRAHWENHRKACLHSRASNLCRQVLATCKDDLDTQRHLSLLSCNGCFAQGRGVVRMLFRSPEAAECFIKNGFQCMGEASYVRWPDLMPAEMGLELYSELLKLSTEYRPESKMLIYVAICVVSESPGMGQAPVRWERQLVSRCAKLKLCKTVLAEIKQQQEVVAMPERTEILILTFNARQHHMHGTRELIFSNILDILSRRGVKLRKHYPEIFQRLQTYSEGKSDKFNPVTLHPRNSQTGQSFVCIIMPVQTDSGFNRLPSGTDSCNRVTTIDVASLASLAQLDEGVLKAT